METAIFILIAIISALIILLLSALIVIAVFLVRITKNLRMISDRAEVTSRSIADIALMASKKAAPVAASAALAAILRKFKR